MASTTQLADRRFFAFNAVVSAGALSLLAWLLLLHDGVQWDADLSFMPAVNASFNALAATFLVLGWVAIRRGRRVVHQRLMIAAFVSSTLFLMGYLAYHFVHGDTRYTGEGPLRTVYFVVLISHIVLSVPIVPMALSAFYFAWKKRFATHKRITRILAPIWLYVSVTGVLVFFLLHGA